MGQSHPRPHAYLLSWGIHVRAFPGKLLLPSRVPVSDTDSLHPPGETGTAIVARMWPEWRGLYECQGRRSSSVTGQQGYYLAVLAREHPSTQPWTSAAMLYTCPGRDYLPWMPQRVPLRLHHSPANANCLGWGIEQRITASTLLLLHFKNNMVQKGNRPFCGSPRGPWLWRHCGERTGHTTWAKWEDTLLFPCFISLYKNTKLGSHSPSFSGTSGWQGWVHSTSEWGQCQPATFPEAGTCYVKGFIQHMPLSPRSHTCWWDKQGLSSLLWVPISWKTLRMIVHLALKRLKIPRSCLPGIFSDASLFLLEKGSQNLCQCVCWFSTPTSNSQTPSMLSDPIYS